jgi:Flp pilus assembly protein CpaB
MRASFLLVLTLAVLVGLAVAVGVRYSGLLNQPAPQTVVPQAEPKPEPKPAPPPPIRVLATIRNIFAGDTIEISDIRSRVLKEEEKKDYEANKADYLPPNEAIALYRTPTRNLEADTPLKKADLLEMAKPEALHARLTPGTRAMGVSIPKAQSAGGLIQVGDWVDVYVTTDVSRTDSTVKTPHTGLVAKAAQVVAKRDTLHKIYSGLPSDSVQFTLAANPYRTALIEYARTLGTLSLVPVSAEEKKKLDGLRDAAMKDPTKAIAVTVGNPESAEGKEELDRVKDYEAGSLGIGGADMMRILALKPIPVPPPPPAPMIPPPQPAPPAPTPPPPPTTIEVFSGTTKQPSAVFPAKVPPQPAPQPAPPPTPIIIVQQPAPPKPAEYVFSKPAAPAADKGK